MSISFAYSIGAKSVSDVVKKGLKTTFIIEDDGSYRSTVNTNTFCSNNVSVDDRYLKSMMGTDISIYIIKDNTVIGVCVINSRIDDGTIMIGGICFKDDNDYDVYGKQVLDKIKEFGKNINAKIITSSVKGKIEQTLFGLSNNGYYSYTIPKEGGRRSTHRRKSHHRRRTHRRRTHHRSRKY